MELQDQNKTFAPRLVISSYISAKEVEIEFMANPWLCLSFVLSNVSPEYTEEKWLAKVE